MAKNRISKIISFLLICSFLMAGCEVDSLNHEKAKTDLSSHCSQVISAMESLQQKENFNPQDYFQVMTHLSVAPGYRLDDVYYQDEMGGYPLIYARKEDEKAYLSYEEYLSHFNEADKTEPAERSFSNNADYLKVVRIDNSPESYFEYVALATIGNQFNLFWHAGYNDTQIICFSEDIAAVQNDLKNTFQIEFPEDLLQKAQKIDFTPTVEIENEQVTLRYVSFTKWGGFFENTYTLEKNNPDKIIESQSIPLLEYNCGIAF